MSKFIKTLTTKLFGKELKEKERSIKILTETLNYTIKNRNEFKKLVEDIYDIARDKQR